MEHTSLLDWMLWKLRFVSRKRYEEQLKNHASQLIEAEANGYNKALAQVAPKVRLVYEQSHFDSEEYFKTILPEKPLSFTDAIEAEIVNDLLTPGSQKAFAPTDSQKQLILSDNRNTLVIAGAGSGKSTTLIQRVLVLNKYLGIPLNHITVFSFTRASCDDFRKKLIAVFKKHGITITQKQAENVVRTFHSKVYQFARGTMLPDGVTPFEFLKNKKDGETDEDIAESLTSVSKLDDPQKAILRSVYRNVYKNNPSFKETIDALNLIVLTNREHTDEAEERAKRFLDLIVQRDLTLTISCYDRFDNIPFEKPENPIPIRLDAPHASKVMYANYYLEEHGVYVVIAPDYDTCKHKRWLEETVDTNHRIKYVVACNNKVTTLPSYSSENIYIIRNHNDIARLIKFTQEYACDSTAPMFDIKLDGEISFSHICEAFYNQATFIESMGVDVNEIGKHFQNFKGLSLKDTLFIKAMIPFWNDFLVHLEDSGYVLFSRFFKAFSSPTSEAFQSLSADSLKSMQHILIDEYQDISPQEIKWIKAVLQRQKYLDIDTSLVCVGDDYQSIYGWKGSSPSFIMNHTDHFPTKSPLMIKMEENFRSYQEIVTAAESVLSRISNKNKSDKKGICSRGNGGQLYLHTLSDDAIDEHVFSKIKEIDAIFCQLSSDEQEKQYDRYCLVLSRSNDTINAYKKAYKSYRNAFDRQHRKPNGKHKIPIRFETFHRSKGLEAVHTILLEDCKYSFINPIKNMVYKLAQVSEDSYDDTQREEALRLAYVAVTRAMDTVHWFATPQDEGAYKLVNDHLMLSNTSKA